MSESEVHAVGRVAEVPSAEGWLGHMPTSLHTAQELRSPHIGIRYKKGGGNDF